MLPEFFTLLGIEIFSASSFVSALLDRDIPSPAPWLFQGAAAIGLAELVVSQGFVNTGSTDLTRFWVNIFYLTLSVCSIGALNIYIANVNKNLSLASIFLGTLTVPAIIISGLFISSYLNGGDVSFTPVTIAILMTPGIVIGASRLKNPKKTLEPSKPVSSEPAVAETLQKESESTPPIETTTANPETPSETPPDTPSIFEPLDLQDILRQWEEDRKKNEQGQ